MLHSIPRWQEKQEFDMKYISCLKGGAYWPGTLHVYIHEVCLVAWSNIYWTDLAKQKKRSGKRISVFCPRWGRQCAPVKEIKETIAHGCNSHSRLWLHLFWDFHWRLPLHLFRDFHSTPLKFYTPPVNLEANRAATSRFTFSIGSWKFLWKW